MTLEQYLNTNSCNNYDLNIVTDLFEKQGHFYALSYSRFPIATEYMTENINGIKCLLIFTSENMTKMVNTNWHVAKYQLSELETLMNAIKTNAVCINYGFNWLVLTLKKEKN